MTGLAGVIGWPVGHSRSPLIHRHWLAQYGIDGDYVRLAVAPAHLADAVAGLTALGFVGANVTVPHKQATLALCRTLDPAAAQIGAVNTLICTPDGGVAGHNTDAPGFLAALDQGAADWRHRTRAVTVLGAGGAARAVVAALAGAGIADIAIDNRDRARASELAAAFGARALAEGERAERLAGTDLLVNATSLGMTGQPPLAIDLAPLPRHAVVNDLVYAPLETPLLAAARARGLATVDGLGMLLHQAALAFAAWHGVMPAVDAGLRAAVLADLA